MRTDKKDYPNRRYVSFSDEQWELMRRASDATGNTLVFLTRKWCTDGAMRDIMARKKPEQQEENNHG